MATTQWRQIPVVWIKRAGAIGALMLVVVGCATTRDEVFPKEGPTMVDIYEDITSGRNTLIPKHKKYKKQSRDEGAALEQDLSSILADETNWFMYDNLKKYDAAKSAVARRTMADNETLVKPVVPRADAPAVDEPQRSKAALIPVSSRTSIAPLTPMEVVSDELRVQFQRVENPVIVLWVAPHRSAEGLPIPAYSTAFRMYEKDEFAQPGEVIE